MRSRRFLIYGILVVLVVSIGVTYAYFTSNIENKNGKLSINSKEINIIFTDTIEISDLNITPGWSTSKSFSIENKSNDVFNYNIVLEDLINTFETVGNLQYKITSTNGYNMEDYADIPKSKESKDVILAYDIDIEKDVKHEYTIEFIYKNSTEDQSIDMNKEFSGTLAITEGSIDPNKKYSVTIELENGTITSDNPQESIKKGSLTYTYELNEGYEIGDAKVVCSGSAKGEITENNIVISDIREDQICTISPSKKKYTLSIGTNDANMGTVSPSSSVIEHGNNASITINPVTGYKYKSNNCEGIVTGNIMTIENITLSKSCIVTFEPIIYTVTVNVTNGTYSGNTSVAYGKNGRYTITPNEGYKLDDASVSGIGCTLSGGTLTVSNVQSNRSCSLILEKEKPTFYVQLLNDNPVHTGNRPNLNTGLYDEENTGVMYVANGNQTEDGSNVYYFAGNAKNNWVKFGQDVNDNDLYWRIIRTNEDKSVRLLYSGISPDTTEGYIKKQVYNNVTNNPMYVGYMYGTSGSLANNRTNLNSSTVKTEIDNWYNNGLNTKNDGIYKYDKYISRTAIYCNDRAHGGTYSINKQFYYAGFYRLTGMLAYGANTGKNVPSYKCGNNENGSLFNTASSADKFSVSTSKGGNGSLTYPVALMTADEILFAGGAYLPSSYCTGKNWFYQNSESNSIVGKDEWFTMTPYMFDLANNGTTKLITMFSVRGSLFRGCLFSGGLYSQNIRPVLSLKSCIKWKSGNGAWDTPYEVSIDSTCALAEN